MAEMTVRETLDFAGRCQGVGFKYGKILATIFRRGYLIRKFLFTSSYDTDMLLELARREKIAGIKPDEDLDLFMKVFELLHDQGI